MLRHFLIVLFLLSLFPTTTEAHRSGCHRWHSCPSDSGSYICGDTGHCSACPDNQYCENMQPISRQVEPSKTFDSPQTFITEESLNSAMSHCQLKLNNASRHFNNIFFKIQVFHGLSEFFEMTVSTYDS